jgi:hypothetical protein
MQGKISRKKKATSTRSGSAAVNTGLRGWCRRFLLIVPSIVAVVLSIPGFRFPYLSDDYDFLYTAQTFRPAMLLPSYDVMFYRPLSREAYFLVLNALGGANPFIGHLINAAVLAATLFLLVLVASDLVGRRAGLVAGLIFATFGQVPFLVGFVSGIQDLLAIMLFLLAFHFQLRTKPAAAIICFGLSLLAKEIVVALVPALVLVPWVLGRSGRRRAITTIGYVSVVAGWLAIHPGIRMLATHGFEPGGNLYLGLYPGAALRKVGAFSLTLLNLPPGGVTSPWPEDLTIVFVVALAFLFAGLWIASRSSWPARDEPPASMPWVVIIASGMVLVTGAASAVLLRQWSPYYLCVPALGLSILVGLVLRSRGWLLTSIVAGVWLAAGVWSRGDHSTGPTVSTEHNFAIAGQELKTVERGFRQLQSTFPRNSKIYVSVMGTGLGNVYNALYRYQCLRVWYQDPSLRTADPVNSIPGRGPEFLLVVRQDLVVDEVVFHQASLEDSSEIEITLGAPTSDYFGLILAIRNRAIGQATAGDVEGGVRMLLSMPVPSESFRVFNWRLAAVLLLAHDSAAEAQAVIDRSPISRRDAADYLYTFFIHTNRPELDDVAFRCFEVSPRDPVALRSLLRRLEGHGHVEVALRCARLLVELIPTDPEARGALQRLKRIPEPDRVTRRADE